MNNPYSDSEAVLKHNGSDTAVQKDVMVSVFAKKKDADNKNTNNKDETDNKNETEAKACDKMSIGFGICGSFCTFSRILPIMRDLSDFADVIPILSGNAAGLDTRFSSGAEFIKKTEEITGNRALLTFNDAEPIGPKKLLDVLLIAPCTGNTIAKIANGIADTAVTLAVKSQLRNNRPVVIAISTNDGLGGNAANIGRLMVRKNIYLVPFGQDDYINKENSLVSDFGLIKTALLAAFEGKQLQPILLRS